MYERLPFSPICKFMPTIKWTVLAPHWMTSPYDNQPPEDEEDETATRDEMDTIIENELTEEMQRDLIQ